MKPSWILTTLFFLPVASSPLACLPSPTTTPERLRHAYQRALVEDQPEQAYALLSPDLQKKTSLPEFKKQWENNAQERKASLLALQDKQARSDHPTVYGGTTQYADGKSLLWTRKDNRYLVVSGLPGQPDSRTPESTIRTLLATLHEQRQHKLDALLSQDLLEHNAKQWTLRVEAIEAALVLPDAIRYSSDQQRAVLRYAPNRAIVLQRETKGWRAIEFR